MIADPQALQNFFWNHFKGKKLPNIAAEIETLTKKELLEVLENATKNCQKGQYGKGAHSFKLLALINPAKVTAGSPWAKRLVDNLKERMQV